MRQRLTTILDLSAIVLLVGSAAVAVGLWAALATAAAACLVASYTMTARP